jgi:hypothetical protein
MLEVLAIPRWHCKLDRGTYVHTSTGGVELGDEGYPGMQSRWRGGGGPQGHTNPIAAAKLYHEQLTHRGQMAAEPG